MEFGRVPYLECHALRQFLFCEEVEVAHGEVALVCCVGIIAMAYVKYVCLHVFFYHKPWSSSESHSLTLSYGVEPQSFVLSDAFPSFEFYHVAWLFSKITPDVVVVAYFPKAADAS